MGERPLEFRGHALCPLTTLEKPFQSTGWGNCYAPQGIIVFYTNLLFDQCYPRPGVLFLYVFPQYKSLEKTYYLNVVRKSGGLIFISFLTV